MTSLMYIMLGCCIFSASSLLAQQPAAPPKTDSLKVVEIISAERYGFKRIDSLTELLLMVGKVALKQENTLFYADSAVFNRNAKVVEAFGNVHINDNDSIDTYSNYLLYHTDTKIAILRDEVRLTDGKSNLYTQELEYNVNEKIGIYRHGGRVINGTSVLTSNAGTYYADIKDVYFQEDVVLEDPKYYLRSDSLLYNTSTEITTFIAKTYIEDSAKRTIVTSEGFYDLKNKNASFGNRPVIKDGPTTIIANQVDTDDNTGISVLTGNAVFRDTAQGVSVLANSIVSNRTTGAMLATQKPLMIIKQEKDSTFVTADTLYSGRLSELETPAADSISADSLANVQVVTERALQDSAGGMPVEADSTGPARVESDSVMANDTTMKERITPDTVVTTTIVTDTIRQIPARKKRRAARRLRNKREAAIDNKTADSIRRAEVSNADTAVKPNASDSIRQRLPNRTNTVKPSTSDSIRQRLPSRTDTAIKPSTSNSIRQRLPSRTDTAIKPSTSDSIRQRLPSRTDTVKPSSGDSIRRPLTNGTDSVANRNTNDSADRFFRAHRNVRIFSDSMQAVCDSLFYSGKDSIFRLFRDPIVWASNSQVTGDTIFMQTKNKKPHELYVFENGLMINKTGEDMYNQIRGNRLFGYFKEGEIDYVRARGNAESIYYAKDNEDKLVGINKANSDVIDMRFRDKELYRVVFINAVTGTMLPYRQATEEDKRLRNFKWQDDRRPKSKFELFGN